MKKMQRAKIRAAIIVAADEMTSEMSDRESVIEIGGHTLSRRLMYAGGSQWTGCGRNWDAIEIGWAWIVDGQWRLTAPDLFGFDGRNMIERQTGYYLCDGYDPQTSPIHDGRDEIDRVPGRIMLEIGRGVIAAREAAELAAAIECGLADDLIAALPTP